MTLTGIFLNLLPILLLIGVWIFFMVAMRKGSPQQRQTLDANQAYITAHLEEVRQMNRTLERIATTLEDRRAV